MFLAPHEGEVNPVRRFLRGDRPRGGRDRVLPAQEPYRLAEGRHRMYGESVHERCLRRRGGRHDRPPDPRLVRGEGHRQRPPHRPQAPIERELAQEDRVRGRLRAHLAGGNEEGHRQGEVEPRSLLAEVGRGEVGRDPELGEGEARVADCGPDPFPRLRDLLLRQPDDREPGEAGADIALDLDQPRLDPVRGSAKDLGEHPPPGTHRGCGAGRGALSPPRRTAPGPRAPPRGRRGPSATADRACRG